jgi:hypothetical protein
MPFFGGFNIEIQKVGQFIHTYALSFANRNYYLDEFILISRTNHFQFLFNVDLLNQYLK